MFETPQDDLGSPDTPCREPMMVFGAPVTYVLEAPREVIGAVSSRKREVDAVEAVSLATWRGVKAQM